MAAAIYAALAISYNLIIIGFRAEYKELRKNLASRDAYLEDVYLSFRWWQFFTPWVVFIVVFVCL
jgi:hypothetical protein